MKALWVTPPDLPRFFNVRRLIYHTANLNILVSQIFGYFPVSVKSTSHIPQIISIVISVTSLMLALWALMSTRVDTSHPSGTFKSVATAWMTFIFIMQSISRLSLLVHGRKLRDLLDSSISTVEQIIQFQGFPDFPQFCAKLRNRSVKLVSFYALSAIVISLLQLRNILWTESNRRRNILSDILMSIMTHVSLFSFLSLEFFCQIYNYCLTCVTASIGKGTFSKKNLALEKFNDINVVLDCFNALADQVQQFNAIYEGKMVVDVFYYFTLCIFRGYFATQLGSECCSVTSLVYFVIHLMSICIMGYGVWSIASLSTKLGEGSGRFFRELANISTVGVLDKGIMLKVSQLFKLSKERLRQV